MIAEKNMARQSSSSQTTVTATDMRRNFNAVLRRLNKHREHTIIQSGGTPVAVLLSIEEYERLIARERLAAFDNFARHLGMEVEKRGLSEEALLADLEVTKRRVFEEQYGRPATKAANPH